ncbi:BA75_03060T0 [Komagataella pastoris]|uniref:Chromosome segregation in meiosis protein n=1 Tax=Komagataella pastoris TaxID=4922 RepID=A0A1B2JC67_PICPA|nr:BA75_03060T0 [Komagataella pastoris]
MSDKLDPDNILGAATDAGSKDTDESNQDLLGPKKSTSTRKKLYVLNEDVLLSSKGYPELLRQCQHFKFKKRKPYKEFTRSYHMENMEKLLQMYQLWGHQVYPRANFNDFTKVCARASNRPRVKRWRVQTTKDEINKKFYNETGQFDDILVDNEETDERSVRETTTGEPLASSNTEPQDSTLNNQLFVNDDDDDDIYTTVPSNNASTSAPTEPTNEEMLDLDESAVQNQELDFQDELEAMREMGM